MPQDLSAEISEVGDETRPTCQRCASSNDRCDYASAVRFRPVSLDGVRTSVGSTSLAEAASQEPPSWHGTAAEPAPQASRQNEASALSERELAEDNTEPSHQERFSNNQDDTDPEGLPPSDNPLGDSSFAVNPDPYMHNAQDSLDATVPDITATDPMAPMTVSSGQAVDGRAYGLPTFGTSPEDGIFEPGSTYSTLYRTLRRKVFHAAARAEETPHEPAPSEPTSRPSKSPDSRRHHERQHNLESDLDCELDTRQEYVLWKIWTEEVASWVSNHHHL